MEYKIEDLIIRTPLDPDITFSDDPLRMMNLDLLLNWVLIFIIRHLMQLREIKAIKIVSMERVTDELNKIILSPNPLLGL